LVWAGLTGCSLRWDGLARLQANMASALVHDLWLAALLEGLVRQACGEIT